LAKQSRKSSKKDKPCAECFVLYEAQIKFYKHELKAQMIRVIKLAAELERLKGSKWGEE
jgi:hypothetical protein